MANSEASIFWWFEVIASSTGSKDNYDQYAGFDVGNDSAVLKFIGPADWIDDLMEKIRKRFQVELKIV